MAAFERFYEAEYPPVDSVVMAKIISIGETMFQAKLLEYDKTAFILRNNILANGPLVRATRRLTTLSLGEEIPRHVLRVEPDKDFIDLSSQTLRYVDARYHKEQYLKSKMVVSILRHTCIQMNLDEKSCEELVRNTSWYFDKKFDRRGKTYEIFQHAVSNPCVLDECDIDAETRAALLRVIRLKLAPAPVTLRSVVEVTCFTYEGIDAIKRALKQGLSVASESCPLEIRVVACPQYEITTKTMDKDAGIRTLRSAHWVIEENIVQSGGQFKTTKQPHFIFEDDARGELTWRRILDSLRDGLGQQSTSVIF